MGSLFWLYTFAVMAFGMFLLVPVKKIMDFFSMGLVFGAMLALAIMFVGQNVLNLWVIREPLVNIAGFDLLLTLDWFFAVVVFTNYIKFFSHNWSTLAVYILLFAAAATTANNILIHFGYWINLNWSSAATFLLALGAHLAMSAYLLLRGNIPRPGKII